MRHGCWDRTPTFGTSGNLQSICQVLHGHKYIWSAANIFGHWYICSAVNIFCRQYSCSPIPQNVKGGETVRNGEMSQLWFTQAVLGLRSASCEDIMDMIRHHRHHRHVSIMHIPASQTHISINGTIDITDIRLHQRCISIIDIVDIPTSRTSWTTPPKDHPFISWT